MESLILVAVNIAIYLNVPRVRRVQALEISYSSGTLHTCPGWQHLPTCCQIHRLPSMGLANVAKLH